MTVPVAERKHPCPYSPEVLAILRELIHPGEHIHDPFAGEGRRLAALCDEIGATFSGTDIENWGGDDRVRMGNSKRDWSYPAGKFTIATSPVYQNKRLADYANGPLPTTKIEGRRDYGIALGRALHEENLARTTGKASRAEAYWALHGECVKHWGDRVLLNVDEPIAERWQQLLEESGYRIVQVIPAYTQRYRGLANDDKRAEHEVVIVARKR